MKTKSRNLISVTLVTTQCLHTIPTIPEQRLLRTILLPTMMVDSAQMKKSKSFDLDFLP